LVTASLRRLAESEAPVYGTDDTGRRRPVS
jgi:hypothetical protein